MDDKQLEDVKRMRMLVIATVALAALILSTVWVAVCCGQEMTDEYVFAVVARNPGEAGTVWRTGACFFNPQFHTIAINLHLVQDGFWVGTQHSIDSHHTLCSNDFLHEWFGLNRYQGSLVARAVPESDRLFVQFTPAVWVYNEGGETSFGVNVQPFALWEGQEDDLGAVYPYGGASGLIHWGTPGVDGFRTSVGAFNFHAMRRHLRFEVREAEGEIVWLEELTLEPYSQRQIALPSGLELEGGSIEVWDEDWQDWGDPGIFGYATVTNNQTGDGIFRPMSRPHLDVIAPEGADNE